MDHESPNLFSIGAKPDAFCGQIQEVRRPKVGTSFKRTGAGPIPALKALLSS